MMYRMSFLRLNYPELLSEFERIKRINTATITETINLIETLTELTADTEIEHLTQILSQPLQLFQNAANFFEDVELQLTEQQISYSIVQRMSTFGTGAFQDNLDFRNKIDKENFYKVAGTAEHFNNCYALVGDNYVSLSCLEDIAHALNTNFRHIRPFGELAANNITFQSVGGITVTDNDEIYIGEELLCLEGQKKEIFLLLLKYERGVGWDTICEQINSNVELTRAKIVNLVSALRVRLERLGIPPDTIEIRQIQQGNNATWKMIER